MNYLFLDTETTGLNDPRLVSLAYTLYDESMISYGLFKSAKPISEEAMSVHHITDKMLKNKPLFKDSPDFHKLQKLCDENYIVAHNAQFDIRVLKNEGIIIDEKYVLCTYQLAKKAYPQAPCHKLQFLRYYLGLEVDAIAHNAMGDVMVLQALFDRVKHCQSIGTTV